MNFDPILLYSALRCAAIHAQSIVESVVEPDEQHTAMLLPELKRMVDDFRPTLPTWQSEIAAVNRFSCVNAGIPATSWHEWALILSIKTLTPFEQIASSILKDLGALQPSEVSQHKFEQYQQSIADVVSLSRNELPTIEDFRLVFHGMREELRLLRIGDDPEIDTKIDTEIDPLMTEHAIAKAIGCDRSTVFKKFAKLNILPEFSKPVNVWRKSVAMGAFSPGKYNWKA